MEQVVALTPEQVIEGLFFAFCFEYSISTKEAKALLLMVSGVQKLKDFNIALRLKHSTGTTTLDAFEAGGMFKRVQSKDDRRAINVILTKKGISFLKNFSPRVNLLLELLDSEKAAELINCLKVFTQKISLLK